MRSRRRIFLALLAAALALCSCASIQRSMDVGSVGQIARLINTGQAQALADMSALPFLLDQEIVVLPADIAAFWQAVASAGFRINEPTLERGASLTESSYLEFSDSMEARSFFRRYVKAGTRLLELKSSSGQRLLLLTRESWFSRKIYGLKGPF